MRAHADTHTKARTVKGEKKGRFLRDPAQEKRERSSLPATVRRSNWGRVCDCCLCVYSCCPLQRVRLHSDQMWTSRAAPLPRQHAHTAASEQYLWICNTAATFIWGLCHYMAIKLIPHYFIGPIPLTSATLFLSSFLIHRHRSNYRCNLATKSPQRSTEAQKKMENTIHLICGFSKAKAASLKKQLEWSHRWCSTESDGPKHLTK